MTGWLVKCPTCGAVLEDIPSERLALLYGQLHQSVAHAKSKAELEKYL